MTVDPLLGSMTPTSSQLSLKDLELLHHYTTVACPSLSNILSKQQTWQIAVPREALSYDFLMHALLALAAVHLMHVNPERRPIYVQEALKHQSLALKSSLPSLHNVTPSNCHALFALSSIVAVLNFVFPYPRADTLASSPLDDVIEFFFLIRGVKTVQKSASAWISKGPLAQLMRYDWDPALNSLPEDVKLAFDRLGETNDAATTDLQDHQMYNMAIEDLRISFQSHKLISNEPALVFIWPVVVESTFLTRLKQREPIPLAILAHYSVLLHTVKGRWWSAGRGSQLMEIIYHILPPEWRSVLDWPREAISKSWQSTAGVGDADMSWRDPFASKLHDTQASSEMGELEDWYDGIWIQKTRGAKGIEVLWKREPPRE